MSEPTVADVAAAASRKPVTLAHVIAIQGACGDPRDFRGNFLKIATAHFILQCTPASLGAQYEAGGWHTVQANAIAAAGGISPDDAAGMAEEIAAALEGIPA